MSHQTRRVRGDGNSVELGLAWHRAARSVLSTAALRGLQGHHPTGGSLQQPLVQRLRWCQAQCGAGRQPRPAGLGGVRRGSAGNLGGILSCAKSLPMPSGCSPAPLRCLPRCLQHAAAASTAFACPAGPCELAHPGSPDAGRAAVRVAGHHPVHGLLGRGGLRCGRARQRSLSGLALGRMARDCSN